MTTPLDSPTSFDGFTLDGVSSPGLSRIQSGGERTEEWQEMQTPGETGATVNFRYEHVSKLSYQIELWEPAHFDAWNTWIAMLSAGKAQRPPRVYTLNDLRVVHNQIKNVAYASCGPQQLLSPGKWGYVVAFVEKPKRRAMGGPLKAPTNAVEQKIVALSAENQVLSGALNTMNLARQAGH